MQGSKARKTLSSTPSILFGQSKPIVEKSGDKGLISLDPALPEPTKIGLRLPLQESSSSPPAAPFAPVHGPQLALGGSPLGDHWVTSSCGCGELARGTKN